MSASRDAAPMGRGITELNNVTGDGEGKDAAAAVRAPSRDKLDPCAVVLFAVNKVEARPRQG